MDNSYGVRPVFIIILRMYKLRIERGSRKTGQGQDSINKNRQFPPQESPIEETVIHVQARAVRENSAFLPKGHFQSIKRHPRKHHGHSPSTNAMDVRKESRKHLCPGFKGISPLFSPLEPRGYPQHAQRPQGCQPSGSLHHVFSDSPPHRRGSPRLGSHPHRYSGNRCLWRR